MELRCDALQTVVGCVQEEFDFLHTACVYKILGSSPRLLADKSRKVALGNAKFIGIKGKVALASRIFVNKRKKTHEKLLLVVDVGSHALGNLSFAVVVEVEVETLKEQLGNLRFVQVMLILQYVMKAFKHLPKMQGILWRDVSYRILSKKSKERGFKLPCYLFRDALREAYAIYREIFAL